MKNTDNIQFHAARQEQDLQLIEKLAAVIWEEHYTPIIGADQVRYMLDKFQSAAAMLGQIGGGYEYFIIREKENSLDRFCHIQY